MLLSLGTETFVTRERYKINKTPAALNVNWQYQYELMIFNLKRLNTIISYFCPLKVSNNNDQPSSKYTNSPDCGI